jgi:hypothetical protein
LLFCGQILPVFVLGSLNFKLNLFNFNTNQRKVQRGKWRKKAPRGTAKKSALNTDAGAMKWGEKLEQ